jgi:hypothetical protein
MTFMNLKVVMVGGDFGLTRRLSRLSLALYALRSETRNSTDIPTNEKRNTTITVVTGLRAKQNKITRKVQGKVEVGRRYEEGRREKVEGRR